jgi:hypothetical protein
MSFLLLPCAAFAAAVPHPSVIKTGRSRGEEAAQASVQSERSGTPTLPQTSAGASSANPRRTAADRVFNMPDRRHEQANAPTLLVVVAALRIRARRNGAA